MNSRNLRKSQMVGDKRAARYDAESSLKPGQTWYKTTPDEVPNVAGEVECYTENFVPERCYTDGMGHLIGREPHFNYNNAMDDRMNDEVTSQYIVPESPSSIDHLSPREEYDIVEDGNFKAASSGPLQMIQNQPESLKAGKRIYRKKKKVASGAKYTEYEADDVIKFISAVHDAPLIWNSSDEAYHRKEDRQEAFNEIEKEMTSFMSRGKPHGKSASTLWEQLSSEYAKAARRVDNAPSGTGIVPTGFPFYNYMSFLEEDRQARAVKNAYIIGPKDQAELEIECDSKPRRTPEHRHRSPKRDYMAEIRDSFVNSTEKTTDWFCRQTLPAPTPPGRQCSSSICKHFEAKTKGWTDGETCDLEADILMFIKNAKRGSETTSTVVQSPP